MASAVEHRWVWTTGSVETATVWLKCPAVAAPTNPGEGSWPASAINAPATQEVLTPTVVVSAGVSVESSGTPEV